MKTVGISVYFSFEPSLVHVPDSPSRQHYRLEDALSAWIDKMLGTADHTALGKEIEKVLGYELGEFFLTAIADKTTSKDEAILKEMIG